MINTIKIKDFVSNDNYANKLITTFDSNKYIIKGDTGIGGTSAILNITDQNVIIISPLTGMIVGKEAKKNTHQMFKYKDSKDNWFYYEREISLGNKVILNCTPEQIIELKNNNPDLFNKVMHFPFFVDEFQVYSESHYRTTMPEFYNILFKEHRGNYILSTATPTYKHLDIPQHIQDNMEFHKIEHTNPRKKPISIAPINNYWNYIKSNCAEGNKVVLFTNDYKRIKNFLDEKYIGTYKVQLLVGKKLATDTSGAKSKKQKEYNYLLKSQIDSEADIYILSTKYLIGFDLDFDACIAVIMDEYSEVDCFNANQIMQAYGRVRGNVINAKIFYRSKPQDVNANNIILVQDRIQKTEFDDKYLKTIQPDIKTINHIQSYPATNLKQTLENYGFDVTIEDTKMDAHISTKVNFEKKYKNLITQEYDETFILRQELNVIVNNIKGDDPNYSGFGKRDLLLWATAFMALECKSEYLLTADAQRYERLLKTAKTFIDVNDEAYPDLVTELDKITKYRVSDHMKEIAKKNGAIMDFKVSEVWNNITMFNHWSSTYLLAKQIINSLYVIHMVENEEYSEETKRIVNAFSVASKCVIEDYITALSSISNTNINHLLKKGDNQKLDKIKSEWGHKLNRTSTFNNTNRTIKRLLNNYEGYTQSEINQVLDKVDSMKSSLLGCKHGILNTIQMNTYSLENQKKRHSNYILSLLSLYCAGHMHGFKSVRVDNRIFNTATKTTRQLRGYTPYEINEFDINSAYPSFVDEIVGSTIAKEVYNNLMTQKNIDRNKAKKLYNMMLNDHTRNPLDARTFFKSCGYNNEQVTKIMDLTLKKRGSFYKRMTQMEDQLIYDFKTNNRLDNNVIRLHDAILVYNLPSKRNLYTDFGRYNFEQKIL